jgi:hypothetical protein
VLDDTSIKIIIGSGWIVSWCFGHLVELAAPAAYGEQYRRWSYETLPIIPEKWRNTGIVQKIYSDKNMRTLICCGDVWSKMAVWQSAYFETMTYRSHFPALCPVLANIYSPVQE